MSTNYGPLLSERPEFNWTYGKSPDFLPNENEPIISKMPRRNRHHFIIHLLQEARYEADNPTSVDARSSRSPKGDR